MRLIPFTGLLLSTGKFSWGRDQQERLQQYMQMEAEATDCPAAIYFEKLKPTRNLGQNGLYYLRREHLAKLTGIHKDELHRICMERCGFGEYKKIFDRVEFIRESSAKLSVPEFSRLIKEQKEIADFFNEDLPPEKWIIMPGDEMEEPSVKA